MSLFPYYGGKGRLARKYPRPHFDRVVEPFAGGANYSLLWPARRVELYDIDPMVVAVWRYLIATPAARLLELPVLEQGQRATDMPGLCEEERVLLSMWAQPGSVSYGRGDAKVSTRGVEHGWGQARRLVARQVETVRHWTIEQRSWQDVPVDRGRSTWFVDPPYQGGDTTAGSGYREGRDGVDFAALGEWCRTLPGQVIACDHEDATWLPFKPLSHQHKQTNDEWRTELVWLAGPQPMTARLGAAQDRGRVTVYHY